MTVCLSCHKEFASTAEKPQKFCLPCRREKLERTWKKQMRVYSMVMIAGLGMLVYAYVQLQGQKFHGLQDVSSPVLGMVVLGGLGLMGGLFGLALAVFFHLWHAKSAR